MVAPSPTPSARGGGARECSPSSREGVGEGVPRLNDRLSPPPPAAGDPDAVRHHRHQLRGDPVRTRRPGRADDRRTAGQGRSLLPSRRRGIGVRQRRQATAARAASTRTWSRTSRRLFGFDKPPLTRFARHGRRLSALRLRPQLLPRPVRAATHPAEDAGIDLARSVVHAAGVLRLDPSRHRQGGARRHPLRSGEQRRRAGRLRHPELPVRHPAGRAVRRRQLLSLVPAARPHQRGRRRLEPPGAHRRLRVAHGAADDCHGGGRLRQPDDADQELLPRGDQQAIYGHRPRQGRQRTDACCTATCSATPCC